MRALGPCDCCGSSTLLATGLIYRDGTAHAGYQVIWTPGRVETHGAEFFFFVGDWGEESGPQRRVAVALHMFQGENGAEFGVVDAGGPLMKADQLAESLLTRNEVIGTPFAKEVFDLVDFVWLTDSRISELTACSETDCGCSKASDFMEHSEREGDADMDDPAFFDVPGFGDGISREAPGHATPPVVILAVAWAMGGVLLAVVWRRARPETGGDWPTRILSGLIALAAILALWKITTWYLAGRKADKTGPEDKN